MIERVYKNLNILVVEWSTWYPHLDPTSVLIRGISVYQSLYSEDNGVHNTEVTLGFDIKKLGTSAYVDYVDVLP